MAKRAVSNGQRHHGRHQDAAVDEESNLKLSQVRTSDKTVIVGCKLPNGLILRIFRFEEQQEPILGGGFRSFKIAKPVDGVEYKLNGVRFPYGTVPDYLIVNGYALTSGIPEDFWKTWVEQNKDALVVKNELIIAHRRTDSIKDQAYDNRKVKSGLEPLDPENPPKGFHKIKPILKDDVEET
jgi:hypothetical protein